MAQTWLVHRSELTSEQLRAVEHNTRTHRIIYGAPGSGKTQVLVHRADYLRRELGASAEQFRLFVFTNALKNYIHSSLELLELPIETVQTFDDWCHCYYRKHIDTKIPWKKHGKGPDHDLVRQRVHDKICNDLKAPLYDFLLVDEAQDLYQGSFEIFCKIAKHVTVCIDNKQQIYNQGSSESVILQALGLKRRNAALLSAFRCCPYVSQLAAEFIANPTEKDIFIQQINTEQNVREKPLLYVADDFDDERAMLVERVRERLNLGERIAVLFPQRRQVYGYAHAFEAAGIEVEVPASWGKSKTFPSLDFTSDLPKLIPYHSAKGLTFDSVLMPKLDKSHFSYLSQDMLLRLLFVGVSRATKWVYLSGISEILLPEIQTLQALDTDDFLAKQFQDDVWHETEDISQQEEDEDLTDIL